MAVVYTAFGVAAGLAGEGLAAALQNPWVLGAFALGLVALSLSMFGVYNLQLPSALASRFTSAAQKLPAGRVAGVFAMGGVSALDRQPLRRRAARRRSCSTSARRATSGSAAPRCSRSPRA